jgi:hypothetical protein
MRTPTDTSMQILMKNAKSSSMLEDYSPSQNKNSPRITGKSHHPIKSTFLWHSK